MAKVHKAHKHGEKYGFQKKKVNVKALLIILAVVIVAAIGLKIAYDNYVGGEFEVTAPANDRLNNIAENWEILNTHTDKFMNYYSALGYSTDGTDGNGHVVLLYYGNDTVDQVYLQLATTMQEDDEVETAAAFARTTLADFINGAAPWGKTQMKIDVANANCAISIYDADADVISDDILETILAEIEAIIAEGPVVTEEETAEEETAEEETAEEEAAVEETPAEPEATEPEAEVTEPETTESEAEIAESETAESETAE